MSTAAHLSAKYLDSFGRVKRFDSGGSATSSDFNPYTGLPNAITSTPAQIQAGMAGQAVTYTPQQIAQMASLSGQNADLMPTSYTVPATGSGRSPLAQDGGSNGKSSGNSTGEGGYVFSPAGQQAIDNMANGFGNSTSSNAYNAFSGENGFFKYFDQALLDTAVGAATGGAGAGIGGAGGAIVSGAATGAATTATNEAYNNQPITASSIGKGALVGGITQGLNYGASPVTGIISNNIGLDTGASDATSDALAGAITKGALGAGVGALSGALSGTGAARGAEVGGAQGAVSGAVSGGTGSGALGSLAGAGAGILAGSLTKPSTTPAPNTPAPATTSTAGTPTLQALPADPNAGTTNIGAYSGFNQQQRAPINPGITDYDTYGQGPEAQFFNGEQGYTGTVDESGSSTPGSVLGPLNGSNTSTTVPNSGATGLVPGTTPTSSLGGNPLGTTQVRPTSTSAASPTSAIPPSTAIGTFDVPYQNTVQPVLPTIRTI